MEAVIWRICIWYPQLEITYPFAERVVWAVIPHTPLVDTMPDTVKHWSQVAAGILDFDRSMIMMMLRMRGEPTDQWYLWDSQSKTVQALVPVINYCTIASVSRWDSHGVFTVGRCRSEVCDSWLLCVTWSLEVRYLIGFLLSMKLGPLLKLISLNSPCFPHRYSAISR